MSFVLHRSAHGPAYFAFNGLGDSIKHGFFSAEGGVSSGLYDSLNCGFGSDDAADLVAQNRERAAACLDLGADELAAVYQVHSADAITVTAASPKDRDKLVHADGMVTSTPGIGLAILTADCLPLLLADQRAGVIGACHAGWRGAATGIVGATIAAMRHEGAQSITALIGPTIRQASYQIGSDMRDEILATATTAGPTHNEINGCFIPDAEVADRFRFDLPGFVRRHLQALGITRIEDCGEDTYAATSGESPCFFSHRRATHAKAADSGRQISIIALQSPDAPDSRNG
jgi:YfiH family protein